MENWKFPADWKRAHLGNMMHALEQGQVRLRYSCEVAQRIGQRAFVIITLLMPMVSVFLYLLVTLAQGGKPEDFPITTGALVFFALPVLGFLGYAAFIMFPRSRFAEGRFPSESLAAGLLVHDQLDPVELRNAMVSQELEHLDVSIRTNEAQNRKRQWHLKLLIVALSCWFMVTVFSLSYLSLASGSGEKSYPDSRSAGSKPVSQAHLSVVSDHPWCRWF